MSASVAQDSQDDISRVRRLRRDETSLWSSHVAHAWGERGGEIVIVDTFPASLSDSTGIRAQAERLVGARHPNLATVRSVLGSDVIVVSEFVEGERLDSLRTTSEVPLDVSMRILVDVLAALSAIHNLGIVHGHIEPANVVVGLDGVAKLVRAYIGPGRLLVIEGGAMHRVAPEILHKRPVDLRADVYGAGALLKDLLVHAPPAWGARLAGVVVTAMSTDPDSRYQTVADMARALRLAAQSHVASASHTADHVDRTAGDRIIARRLELAVPSQRRIVSRASFPSASPTKEQAVTLAAPKASGRTTAMLRARVKAWSRLWIATAALAIALLALLVWVRVHSRATPPPLPIASAAPTPTPTPSATTPDVTVEIVDPAASTHKTTPHHHTTHKPASSNDRSAVF